MGLRKKILEWLFREELQELEDAKAKALRSATDGLQLNERLRQILGRVECSVDVHHRPGSWAIVSLRGRTADYIRFVDLMDADIKDIAEFLSRYDKRKVDAPPHIRSHLIAIPRKR